MQFIIKAKRQIYGEIIDFVNIKLAFSSNQPNKFETTGLAIIFCQKLIKAIAKMPSVDIKLGTALMNTFDGSPDKLESFIDAVTLFSDSVQTEFNAATPEQK